MTHALDFRSSPTHKVTNQPPPLPSQELARVANRNAPELHAFDRFGHRTDVVGFHASSTYTWVDRAPARTAMSPARP